LEQIIVRPEAGLALTVVRFFSSVPSAREESIEAGREWRRSLDFLLRDSFSAQVVNSIFQSSPHARPERF